MISDIPMQSPSIYSSVFSLKEERTNQICLIMDFATKFNMDQMVMHMAIRYFDIILYKIHINNYRLRSSICSNFDTNDCSEGNNNFQYSDHLTLTSKSIQRLSSLRNSKIDLAAATCILIASKVHEIDNNLIRIYEIEKEMKYKYTYKNITCCEAKIYEELNWNLIVQTPYHYVNLFISAGVLFTDDIIQGESDIYIKHNKNSNLSYKENTRFSKIYDGIRKSSETFILDAVQGYEFLQYSDRIIGMACICAARKANKIHPYFSAHFTKLYCISYEDIQEPVEMLVQGSIKPPTLKRNSSWKGVPDTPSRIKDIEYVTCEQSDEQTYRDKKLYPKKIDDKTKASNNSPIYDLTKDQFSDYFEVKDTSIVKDSIKSSAEVSKEIDSNNQNNKNLSKYYMGTASLFNICDRVSGSNKQTVN